MTLHSLTPNPKLRIAFILNPGNLASNVFSGVVAQALCWANGLRALGHEVVFPAAQDSLDWGKFDISHFFQHGAWCDGLITALKERQVKTVLSPIIDPPIPYGKVAKWLSRIPFEKARLLQNQRLLRSYGKKLDLVLARSNFEEQSLRAVGVPASKIRIIHIPLSKCWEISEEMVEDYPRNRAVFHVSHISQPRKNVKALIAAAGRMKFPLRLAGSISDVAFSAWLKEQVYKHPNVTYLGRISDEEMCKEMLSCSVFCLPSLYEGVGLVALDAGLCGAHLVVTDRGGTAEYLGSVARVVNPALPDQLDAALAEALAEPLPNYAGHRHARDNYSSSKSAFRLAQAYAGLL